MRTTVRCFALLRELAVDRCELSLAGDATIDDAWAALAARYPAIGPHRPYVRAARDGAARRCDPGGRLRLFGVVNVQPEFAAGGSGLDKGKK